LTILVLSHYLRHLALDCALTDAHSGLPGLTRLHCTFGHCRFVACRGNGFPFGKYFLTFFYQDSDTNPNTTASSVAGDTVHIDGRKRRSEATQLRKSIFGKKHSRLDESKVISPSCRSPRPLTLMTFGGNRKMIPCDDSVTFSA